MVEPCFNPPSKAKRDARKYPERRIELRDLDAVTLARVILCDIGVNHLLGLRVEIQNIWRRRSDFVSVSI